MRHKKIKIEVYKEISKRHRYLMRDVSFRFYLDNWLENEPDFNQVQQFILLVRHEDPNVIKDVVIKKKQNVFSSIEEITNKIALRLQRLIKGVVSKELQDFRAKMEYAIEQGFSQGFEAFETVLGQEFWVVQGVLANGEVSTNYFENKDEATYEKLRERGLLK